jgi:hypothetical protein
MGQLQKIKELEEKVARLENQLHQENGWGVSSIEDKQESSMSFREQIYYDRLDYVQGRLERGEICEENASELRMGA